MARNLRLLWAYDHPTARYQEVTLYLDAGLEVIVSLGEPNTMKYDRDYHSETHYLYPDWRASCTLPQYVVERVRRISLAAHGGFVSRADAALINRTIDILIVPSDPPVIKNIMTWFKGYMLFRANGAPNKKMFFENIAKIDAIASQAHCRDRFYYAPGMLNLIPHDSRTLKNQSVFLNVWVSPERIGHQWQGRNSKPYVTTAISYIDFHNFFYDQYLNFQSKITAQPYVVLGKNDKESPRCASKSILGATDADTLYGKIAQSRIFVDAVNVPEHLIWPPLEAMQMGVPVYFIENSGLGAVGLDEGYSREIMEQAGMFPDFESLNNALKLDFQNFKKLEAIAERQRAIFMNHIFSRSRSLANMKRFVNEVVRRRPTRSAWGDFLSHAFDWLRYGRAPRHHGINSVVDYLPDIETHALVAYGRIVSPYMMHSETGQIITGDDGSLWREARRFKHRRGHLAINYLPALKAGDYELTVTMRVHKGKGPLARFEVVTWDPVGAISKGADLVATGPGVYDVSFALNVSKESVGYRREMRVAWHGRGYIALQSFRMRTLKTSA